MARACTVCTHQSRREIDLAIVEAEPIRRIAARFGLSETSVRRHSDSHLPAGVQRPAGPRPPPEPPHAAELQQAAVRREADERAHADELVESTLSLETRLLERLDSVVLEADPRGFAAIAGEVRKQRELRAKLMGRLRGAPDPDADRIVKESKAYGAAVASFLLSRAPELMNDFVTWSEALIAGDKLARTDPSACSLGEETNDAH